ncbi:ankyrin repeat domain-containing protein [Nonomuraea insulae]|uniref:Ankyrin repeat domain-containing protein n=1 Tax=Nonomuraea insulae TaxID=1616787 RepID=A0ABW1D955_9ACTN
MEFEDLSQLRDLLDAGHDVEDEQGCHNGWTLLRHAIDVEWDSHAQTGNPLQVNVTAYLLARGADPLHLIKGRSILSEAERIGHWLAADIMKAWLAREGRA